MFIVYNTLKSDVCYLLARIVFCCEMLFTGLSEIQEKNLNI